MNSSPGHTGLKAVANVTPRGRRARWIGGLAASAALVGVLAALAACGGSTTTYYLISAFANLGEPTFTSAAANGGLTTVNASGLSSPYGATAVGTVTSGTTSTTYTYVADTGNNRVVGWALPSTTALTGSFPALGGIAAQFVLGQPSLTTTPSNPGVGTSTQYLLSGPSSARIFTSPSGTVGLLVSDTGNNRVLIWNALPTSGATQPDVVVGQTSFTANSLNQGGTAPAQNTLSGPTDAMFANGDLFVSDNGNDRVLIYYGLPTANGPSANVVLGQPDFVTDEVKCIGNYTVGNSAGVTGGSNAACFGAGQPQNNIASYVVQANQMHQPTGIWTNGYTLLVADTGSNRVLYYPTTPGVVNANGKATAAGPAGAGTPASYVVGVAGFGTYTGAGLTGATGLRAPNGVTEGDSGFYVADTGNNRVLYFSTLPKANDPSAVEVYGQSGFTNNTADNSEQNGVTDTAIGNNGVSIVVPEIDTLSAPTNVSFSNGVLYISDNGNNRIMEFSGQ